MSDARRLLAEGIDTEAYMILDGGTKLEVEGQSYYVFIVANREDNRVVGQLAVNKETGEKYNYEGEGILGDYSEFRSMTRKPTRPLTGKASLQTANARLSCCRFDGRSFEYVLGDRTGVARIDGGTAKDEENDVTFSWDEDGKLVLLGGVEGAFTPEEGAE